MAGEQPETHRSQRCSAGVGAGGEHRREKGEIGPVARRANQVGSIMGTGRTQHPDRQGVHRTAAMASVSPPADSPGGRGCQDEMQAPPRGNRPDLPEQSPPRDSLRPIMAEHDTGAGRQGVQRGPQVIAHPFIRHQPLAGKVLAAAHASSYSDWMDTPETEAAGQLAEVRQGIARAAANAGRNPSEVALIAISKTHDAAAIQPLIDAGHRLFGENRVQEAEAKWPPLVARHPDIGLHLVGQLQSNKAEAAVALFDAIHSVDRPSLVEALARAMTRLGRRPDCFVQVNIGVESQKGGCAIADLPALLALARDAELPLAGLMAVPPVGIEPAPFFALLARLARQHGLTGLSMGMSGDYETAVMLGATHVRVGSALFGARS